MLGHKSSRHPEVGMRVKTASRPSGRRFFAERVRPSEISPTPSNFFRTSVRILGREFSFLPSFTPIRRRRWCQDFPAQFFSCLGLFIESLAFRSKAGACSEQFTPRRSGSQQPAGNRIWFVVAASAALNIPPWLWLSRSHTFELVERSCGRCVCPSPTRGEGTLERQAERIVRIQWPASGRDDRTRGEHDNVFTRLPAASGRVKPAEGMRHILVTLPTSGSGRGP